MKTLLTFAVFIILAVGMVGQISMVHAVTISATIPGSNSSAGTTGTAGPGDYVANFYQFAMLIGGVLALAVVVYGGILYMSSVGNPSGQSEAKAWLLAALWGILLLAGASLILKVINPQLVNLTLPTLQSTGPTANQVTVPGSTAAGTTSGGSSNPSTGSTPAASTCQATSNGGSSGSCPSLPDNTVQNCCNTNGSAVCQTAACTAATATCGSTDSQGNSQNGSCPSGQYCYSYIGWSQKTIWQCKISGSI